MESEELTDEEIAKFGSRPDPKKDLWVPTDVTPKPLRGKGVRVLRLFTGFRLSVYTHANEPTHVWRVQVPWKATGWRTVGTYRKLRLARDAALLHADP